MKSSISNSFLLLILIFASLTLSPVLPVKAATSYTVTNTNDSGAGSLRAAIESAGNGDSIVFSGVTGTILLSSSLSIVHSITISGPGSEKLAVSGGDGVRVFVVGNDLTVSISGLSITHGKVLDGYGGGIFNGSGTLTLDRVTVSYNQALKSAGTVGFGGGIANYGGTMIITNSTLSYNSATSAGGALYNYFSSGLTMTNVIIDHNQALVDSGGGLGIRGPINSNTKTVILDKVSVTNNSAANQAGGLFSDDSMTVTNSLFANNTAGDSYGGLLFYDVGTGAAPIVVTMTNSTITGNIAANNAGGISSSLSQASSSLTLNNVTIAGNQITGSSNGGGISAYGPGLTTVENSIIAGNTSHGATPDDCNGTINSKDYNLIELPTGCTINGNSTHNIYDQSPLLGPLSQNGGSTQTMALLVTSPAIDNGNPGVPGSGGHTCASRDQRGTPRPEGLHCDIGAFEYYLASYNYLPFLIR